MELKVLCLLVTVGVLNVETKITKDFGIDLGDINKLLRGMPQVDGRLLRGMPQAYGKLLRGMPQDNKADATTRVSTPNELFFTFYQSNASSPSSHVATSNIKTCLAPSKAPKTVTLSIYALKAARGTVFLQHRLKKSCALGCFGAYRFENLTPETLESCADAVESSGWANSFTFVDDVCVGYTAWMHSRHTQGSSCDGDLLFYVAENKINNFTEYPAPEWISGESVSRIFMIIIDLDFCLALNKIEVTTLLGSKTFNNTLAQFPFLFEQYNIALCSLNPPVAAKTVNFTFYDYDGKVLWKQTVVQHGPRLSGGSMHPFSGDYGDLCVHQMASKYTYRADPDDPSRCEANGVLTTEFRRTSFLTFAAYRKIISTIPNVPSHFIGAYLDNDNWRWRVTKHVIGAEDFVAGVYPSITNGNCLFANASENYFLAPIQCTEMLNIVCVDFSRLAFDDSFGF